MRKSIITIKQLIKYEYSEGYLDLSYIKVMLIPKVIGKVIRGFLNITKINRLLQKGHRYHGYEV